MITVLPSPEQRLRAAGQRVTAQRVLLLRLLDVTDEHLDAEALYQRARQEMPDINLSTVYRTLAVLKEAGLVAQRYFARDHSREYFEPTTAGEHYHFTCVHCGRVIEFETLLIKQVRMELHRQLGVNVRHACICFEGVCSDCADKSSEQRSSSLPAQQLTS